MNQRLVILSLALLVSTNAFAQWEPQKSGTTANLRGLHAVNASVAWASGAEGTVLHTENGGVDWLRCTTPPGAEKLDFRGVWAWDAKSAMVLSSGPGDQSRVYETKDGCSHWTEMIRNSDRDGFWDAMTFQAGDFGMQGDQKTGVVIGDPIHNRFYTMNMIFGHGWFNDDASCAARSGEAAFAASNTSAFVFGSRRYILVTGGTAGSRALLSPLLAERDVTQGCLDISLPLASGVESAGAFSVFFSDAQNGVTVGGDYKHPEQSSGTAALTTDGGRHWTAATKPPHGYRSAVAWDVDGKVWIAAGTNGSDISRDGGKTWQPLDDGNWNALSLPYIVGPKGSIAKLRANATSR
jgi:photosystem II stability/assembly factor-like uncharacterized protein